MLSIDPSIFISVVGETKSLVNLHFSISVQGSIISTLKDFQVELGRLLE